MYNSSSDILFPSRAIPALVKLRGESWQALVGRVWAQAAASPERLAFILMMARLGRCGYCKSDSFRALHGCVECARHTVHRYRGSDLDLLALYEGAKQEITNYLASQKEARAEGI
jgi:hypothetical protein